MRRDSRLRYAAWVVVRPQSFEGGLRGILLGSYMQRLVSPPRTFHSDISGKRTTRTLRELTSEGLKRGTRDIHDITSSLFFLFFFTIFFSFGAWLLDWVDEWMPTKYGMIWYGRKLTWYEWLDTSHNSY